MARYQRRPFPAVTVLLPEALPDEVCDRCGALACHTVFVWFTAGGGRRAGQLSFCARHYKENKAAFLAAGTREA